MKLKLTLLLIIVITSISTIQAKRYNPYGTDWAFGIHFGGTAFFGDMRGESSAINNTPFSKYFYQDVRIMGGITLNKWFNPYIGVIGNMQYGQIQGTKETSHAWFEANVFEYNLSLMVNLSNSFFGITSRRNSLIYYTLGLGLSESRSWKYSIPNDIIIGTNGNGKPKTTGGKVRPMTENVAVTGIGVRFFIGNGLTLSFEGNVHIIDSDKIDATPNKNTSYIAGIEGYSLFNVGLQYNFGFNGRSSSIRYHRKSRYNSGKGSFVEINPRKKFKAGKKLFKKKRRSFKFKRR